MRQAKLYLKPANMEDWLAEYEALRQIPRYENGYENQYEHVNQSYFYYTALPTIIANGEGRELPPGYVPSTAFFLWEEDETGERRIVGEFKIRHRLTDALRERGGHIGFTVLKPYRGRGYATRGLALALEEAKKLVREDHILMTALKNNAASLRVQQKNGAKIVREGEDYFVTETVIA